MSKLNKNCHYLQSTLLTTYWHYRQQTTNFVIFTYSLYFRAIPTTGSSLATLLLTMVLLGLLLDLLDLPSSTVLYTNQTKPVQTFPNLSKLIQTYPNITKHIQAYPNLSKPIQT
jgi:hypothetical protein